MSDEQFLQRWETVDLPIEDTETRYYRKLFGPCPKCGTGKSEESLRVNGEVYIIRFSCDHCTTPAEEVRLGASRKFWLGKARESAYITRHIINDPIFGRSIVVWRRHPSSSDSTWGTAYKTFTQAQKVSVDDDNRLGMFELTHCANFDEMFGSPIFRPLGKWRGKESIARGNRKQISSVGLFSLPPIITCPGAGVCKNYCYAKKEYTRYKNVGTAWRRNLAESKKSTFVNDVVGWLRIHSDTVKAFRMHESGDFYSQPYVEKWAQIAEASPHIHFYTYTKSLALDLKPLTRLPNFTVVKSYGGKYDKHPRVGIDDNTDHYANVVNGKRNVKRGEYLCPAVAAANNQKEKICGIRCRYCWGRDENGQSYQVKVCFLKH